MGDVRSRETLLTDVDLWLPFDHREHVPVLATKAYRIAVWIKEYQRQGYFILFKGNLMANLDRGQIEWCGRARFVDKQLAMLFKLTFA